MTSLTAWLAAIAWPIVSRLLMSLGIGVVTYKGADLALDSAFTAAKAAFSGMPADMLQIFAIAGGNQAAAIFAGAAATSLALITMQKFAVRSGT